MRNPWLDHAAVAFLSSIVAACTIDAPTFVGFQDGGGADAAPDVIDADPDAPDGGAPTFMRIVHTAADRVYAADVSDGNLATPALLSGAFTNPTATVEEFQVSADGAVITYLVDGTTEGEWEVYVVRHGAEGFSAPQLISADHGSDRVLSHIIKPDGNGVVYTYGANNGLGIFDQRYYVDLSGASPGTPVPLGNGQSVFVGEFSADSSTYAFAQVPTGSSANAAFVVDVSEAVPSTALRISAAPVGTRGTFRTTLSPDGSKIAFLADHVTDDKQELYVVDLALPTPGAPVKISGPMHSQGDVVRYAFSPDSAKIAFAADATTEDIDELFVVDLSGASPGAPATVNGTFVAGGSLINAPDTLGFNPSPFAFVDGSSALAYIADERINDTAELFLVDISGPSPGPSQPLNAALVAGGDVAQLMVSSDGSGLAYTADQQVDNTFDLFYVDLRSAIPSASQRVNADLDAGHNVSAAFGRSFAISNDGSTVAYLVSLGSSQQQELHRAVILDGVPSSPHRLQTVTNVDCYIPQWSFSSDNKALVLRSNPVTPVPDIWLISIAGSASSSPERVNVADPSGPFQVRP